MIPVFLQHLKKALAGNSVGPSEDWIHNGLVTAPEGGGSHWEVNEDGDVIVHVEVGNFGVPVWAQHGPLIGGTDGRGVWYIPDIGTEVVVGFPNGDIEGDAFILASMSSNGAEPSLEEGKVFIKASEVLVYDGDKSEAKALAYKSDVDTIKTIFDAHVHPTALGPSGQTPTPITGLEGTSVLKAK